MNGILDARPRRPSKLSTPRVLLGDSLDGWQKVRYDARLTYHIVGAGGDRFASPIFVIPNGHNNYSRIADLSEHRDSFQTAEARHIQVEQDNLWTQPLRLDDGHPSRLRGADYFDGTSAGPLDEANNFELEKLAVIYEQQCDRSHSSTSRTSDIE